MPWCPKCKNEYKAGYTVCADCGTELVESLEESMKAVYFGADEELYEMAKFLRVNGIEKSEVSYDEKESTYELKVEPEHVTEAQKMIRVYLQNIAAAKEVKQAADAMSAMSEEELEALQKEREYRIKEMMRTPYEDADKKAEDYKSGADALLIVGVIGVVALILLNLGVLPISLPAFTKAMITGVMGIMFVIFIFMGISSRKSYAKLKSQASSDKDTKTDIKQYLKETIIVEEFDKDLCDDAPSMEILYFRRMEKLKEMVFAYSEGIDVSFAEYILEEVYPEIFEQIMKITIITVGKIKEKFYRDAIDEYSKRLSKYCKLEIKEVQDEKTPDNASDTVNQQILAKEGERIRNLIPKDSHVIVLAIEGKKYDSLGFAKMIENAGIRGVSNITFIIGGSLGIDEELTFVVGIRGEGAGIILV